MLRLSALLALLALLPSAQPAFAAPPPVSQQHQLRMRPESAECLIRRRGRYVQAWLSTLAGTAEEKKRIRPVEQDFPACFPSWPFAYASSWNHEGIRRGVIREMLRPRLAALTDQPPPGLSRAAWYPPEQAADPGGRAALLANDLGFCLARSDWASTRALVRAEPDSPEAAAALNTLVPGIAGCLPPGQKLTLDRARLHAIMVETVYHATAA
jgi:hypothetical protein